MALDFPWQMYMQSVQEQNRNRENTNQDIAGIGQGLGKGLGAIGDAMVQKKQSDQWQKTISQMMVNPNIPQSVKNILPMVAQYPELMGQLGPEAMKLSAPPKQQTEYQPVAGMLSQGGKPLIFDKFTGQMREGDIPAKSTGFGSSMGPIRQAQYTLQDLPSNQPVNTAGGAAYQVKVGARQGKNLIAKPGSPQRTAAAAADLVRSITRVAPTDEGLKNANFSQNLTTRWSVLKQKLSADPSSVDNPKVRKEMYDIFDEMDKSATPFIQNQLDDMADAGFGVTPATRKRQLGQTLPDIPFVEGVDQSSGTYSDPGKEARYQAWKKSQGQ